MNIKKIVSSRLDSLSPLRLRTTYFNDHLPEVCAVYSVLADAESQELFLQVVKARTVGNPTYIRQSEYGEYR